jgi:hypothetical protein
MGCGAITTHPSQVCHRCMYNDEHTRGAPRRDKYDDEDDGWDEP